MSTVSVISKGQDGEEYMHVEISRTDFLAIVRRIDELSLCWQLVASNPQNVQQLTLWVDGLDTSHSILLDPSGTWVARSMVQI